MNPLSDHERCSALLGRYVAGDLPADESSWVAMHLSICVDCDAELAALQAMAVVSGGELTDLERIRLHRAVSDAIREPAAPSVIAERGPRWGRRVAPYLGAAAVIALLLVGAAQFNFGGNDDAAGVAAESGAERAPDAYGGGDEDDKVRAVKPESAPNASTLEAEGGGTASSGSGYDSSKPAYGGPPPVFDRIAGRTTFKRVELTAKTDTPFTSFALAYSGRDADRLQETFLGALANRARAAHAARDVRTCGRAVLRQSAGYHSLPAFGGIATIRGTRALLLGFAYTLQEKAPLDRYQLWAWERPGCNNVVLYRNGRIRP